jgi:hypothetical protein
VLNLKFLVIEVWPFALYVVSMHSLIERTKKESKTILAETAVHRSGEKSLFNIRISWPPKGIGYRGQSGVHRQRGVCA